MSDTSFVVLATVSAQTLAAAVIAILLLGFFRQYRKEYLLHWALSWAMLALYDASGAASIAAGGGKGSFTLHAVLAVVAGVAGYLQIGWLVFGVYELVRRRPVRLRRARWTLLIFAAAGAMLATLHLSSGFSPLTRDLLRSGIRSLVAGIAFGASAWTFWSARSRRDGIGFPFAAAALFFYALEQVQYLALSAGWLFFGVARDYALSLGYLDFLISALLGVAMIACLLDDEREAAELATNEIAHLAYHDALTGLPNRPLFIDRLIVSLAQAGRGEHRLAVFFLDLDRFKDINDSLGHTMGDALLKAVADRIRRCIREGDTVARFGGDEFTLLIPRIDEIEDAAKIAQKINETLKIPFLIHEQELFVTTSIGISLFPSDGADPETLVRNADSAMYRAKEQGRDNYQLYAPAMNARALERLALENMLRKAIKQKELLVYYQPLVDVVTETIIGVEALVRWNHPELGMLSPAHFISVAELSGLIIPIGDWVMRTACRQVHQWNKRLGAGLTVAVNLSARQFSQHDLVAQVRGVLAETGLPAEHLELEITESNAMQNAENTIHTLRELKAAGVRISMDDFGTGYSSLNYLKRFPIDTLKLDQSFVRDSATDPSDAAIVSAVISMAHTLNLKVVAEGVETVEQLAFLQRQNCDRIQGFYFSAPVPADALEPYLVQKRAAAQ
jgi:diguanylate cyclase (GGDEF)-like protein